MDKAVEHLASGLANIRTGRATPGAWGCQCEGPCCHVVCTGPAGCFLSSAGGMCFGQPDE